jgi:hypothetical protein
MDHPLIEGMAVLEVLLVLQHLLKLRDHLADPKKKGMTLNDTEHYTITTANTEFVTCHISEILH